MNNEQLVEKWQHVISKAQTEAFTWTEVLSSAWLCEQASHAEFAAEVGVYMGYTSYLMLLANPNLHLWSIDPFMVEGTRFVTEKNLRQFIAQGRSEILPKFTKDGAAQLQHMRGKLDMVWVDDGHALVDVLMDIDSMKPLIRKGGLLCGHDYEMAPVNDVAKAVHQRLHGHYEPVPRVWAYIC